MKSAIFYTTQCLALACLLFAVSCKKTEQEAPNEPNVSANALAKTTATPTISGVSSTIMGANNVNNYTYGNFAGYMGADLNATTSWTISGTNLGTTQGTISLEKQVSPGVWTATTSYSFTVTSWANGQIIIKAISSLSSQDISSARLKVVTSNGTVYSSTFAVVPNIYGRQYIQCTWWVIKRTIETVGTTWAWSPAYSGATTITAAYVPTSNDVLTWQGSGVQHQAFIESVGVSYEPNNVTAYSISLSESNWASATFPHNATFTVKVKNTNGVKTFVSGYSTYRTFSGVSATSVRIQ